MNNNEATAATTATTSNSWVVTRYSGGILVTDVFTNWDAVGSLIALGRTVSVVAL